MYGTYKKQFYIYKKNKMRIKQCLRCRKDFTAKRKDAKYCSNTCRADACAEKKYKLQGVKEFQEGMDLLLDAALKKRMFAVMCKQLQIDDDCIVGKKKKYGYPMPEHIRGYFYEYIGGKEFYEAWKRKIGTTLCKKRRKKDEEL